VSLGALPPGDVDVQVVHGRTNHHGDELHDVSTLSLTFVESYEHGRHQFSGDLALRSSGAFGYTVRVLPRHDGLATTAELGLVANA
jgi:glycogen phosphorylase